jgi:twitching motility protein PilT
MNDRAGHAKLKIENSGLCRDSMSVTEPSLSALNRWLVQLVERRGSDLLLVTDAPACVRVDGRVVSIDDKKLTSDEIENAITPALMPHALRQYLEIRIADSSYRNTNLGRFRINLHQERGRAAATIRALPTTVPFLPELHLPPTVEQLAHLPRGLVLIGGPAGSCKSTSFAALV